MHHYNFDIPNSKQKQVGACAEKLGQWSKPNWLKYGLNPGRIDTHAEHEHAKLAYRINLSFLEVPTND